MRHNWNDEALITFSASCPGGLPKPFIDQVYATRLLGADSDLALHGGGNTSFKGTSTDLLGDTAETLFIKASGCDMSKVAADDFVALDLRRLLRLNREIELDDTAMAEYFQMSRVLPHPRQPSIETLLHAFLPFTCIDHTHPAAILALTNRKDAEAYMQDAFSMPIAVLPYAQVGINLARTAAHAVKNMPGCKGIIISHHGLVTWGATAREAYDATIGLVAEANAMLEKRRTRVISVKNDAASIAHAKEHYRALAPVLRGILASSHQSNGSRRCGLSMVHLVNERILSLLDSPEVIPSIITTPLTPDYIIRVRRLPLFIDRPALDDHERFRRQIVDACDSWRKEYEAYTASRPGDRSTHPETDDLIPRVLLIPGIGAVCTGPAANDARMAADIAEQGLAVKQTIFETGGTYRDLDDEHCFNMEFRSYQRAKLHTGTLLVHGRIVLITGAAGAIGNGLCTGLLENGYQIGVSDLPGKTLDAVIEELSGRFGRDCIVPVPMDVTDEASVREGFGCIIDHFGGLDAVVVNAGIAHVATLAAMELEAFKRLERVNIDGTLLTIREAARLFTVQNNGGDIVLISTKNVFAPGSSFGAYSATKAAAHQIARIASLELASIDVRVNMVAPDAVFSHGGHKSGLWATVGPGRMRSRGLDEAGLEEYYRNRNLLKAKVTAAHVAAAVGFFLERRTPTTGATLPVDGGLPDATPR